MALTRITKGVIKPNENYDTHNINSTGIVTAIGLDINGNGDVSGNLNVGGVLTYEDVTSIDSVGIITTQSDIHVGGGVSAVGVGTFGGLDINGNVDISGDLDVDGHTNLDNVSIAGVTTFASHAHFGNSDKIFFGGNDDLSIYSSGTNGFIDNDTGYLLLNTTSDLVLRANADIYLQPAQGENALKATANGSVDLYYDQNNHTTPKLQTSAKGITVGTGVTIETNGQATYTGIVTAATFSGALPISNDGNNRVITATGSGGLNGESTLTYNGNGTLNVLGASGNTQFALHRTDANTTGTAGIIGFYASDGHTIASMYALGDGDNEGAHLVFNTTTAASGTNPYSDVTERLRITSAGLVQIGLTGMTGGNDQALVVNNPANNANVLELSTSNSAGRINCSRTLSNTLNTTSYIEWTEPGAQGTGDLRFGTSASSNNPQERLRITSGGGLQFRNADTPTNNTEPALILNHAGGWQFYASSDSSTHNNIIFGTNSVAAGERFRIASNGNVSVGNNPTVHADTIFHIEDSGETNVKVEGSTSTLGARISLQNNDTTANAYSQYAFNDAGGQSTSAIQGINTDQTNNYGELAFLTRNAQGTPPQERMRITKDGQVRIADANQGLRIGVDAANYKISRDPTGSDAGLLKFYGNQSGYTGYIFSGVDGERLRITSAGQLGVGVAAPTFAAINSISANAARGIEIYKDGADTGSAIKLAGDNGSGNKAYSQLGYSGANATAHWANYNTSGTLQGEIVIGSTGKIGIGTDIPTYKLHVDSGDAAIGLWKSRRSSGSYIEYAVGADGAALGYIGAGGQILTGGPDSGDFAIRSQGDLCFSAGGSTERARIDTDGNLHIKGTNHATRYYRDDGARYGSIFYDGGQFAIRQPEGDNLQIEKFDGTILHRFNTAGDLSVGHDSPDRKLHVKSGANNNNGAFRIESAPGNIMDMGTDSSMHFLNCVNNDPFRIKFAGNEAIRVTQETSGNWTTSLQFYMETNNGQGASPYIKGVAGTESGGIDAHNAGGFEFHTRTGGAGTDVNAMKIDHNGRVSIGAHNIQNPTAALHIIADTQGTNTALQVGQDSGQRYFRVNELSGQSNFSDVMLSFYDNSLRNILKLQNTFANAAGYGTAIQFIGHGGGQTGKISVRNRDANSASNSIMELSASYVLRPNQPSFSAYHVSGTQSSVLTFNNTYHNIGNHFNASNGTFTCPISGRYLFTFAFLHSNSPTSYARVLFRINGSTNTRYGDTLCDDTGLYINTSMSMIFNLSINDTMQLYCEGNNIYGQPNSQYGSFSGCLLG